MERTVIRRLAAGVVLAAVVSGCSRLGPYTVQVGSVSATDSIQVDIVGVNEAEHQRWATYPLDVYWSPTDTFRKNVADRVVLRFGMGREGQQTIGRKDPCWRAWKARQCRYLLVLTNAGPMRGGEGLQSDPRRLILPLERKRWDERLIQVQVQAGGVVCVNGPRPQK
jgi:hypothetical protein